MEKTILAMDEEIEACVLMKVYFKRKGYEVKITSTLRDAIPLIWASPPDTIYTHVDFSYGWVKVKRLLSMIAPNTELIINNPNLGPSKLDF